MAPWSGGLTTGAKREAEEQRAKANPDTVGTKDASSARTEPRQPPVESAGLTSGTGPLWEELRLTVTRKARAAVGGVYVRPCRGRREG